MTYIRQPAPAARADIIRIDDHPVAVVLHGVMMFIAGVAMSCAILLPILSTLGHVG